MSKANSLNAECQGPLEISSNTFSKVVFEKPEHMHDFAVMNSRRVASILHVLMEVGQDLDSGFLSDVLKVANDLAYQVSQTVELMAERADAGAATS